MEEARDFGMDQGFCVPIHMEGGMQGVVSLVGGTQELDDKRRLELHMLALYAHGQLRFLNSSQSELAQRRAITGLSQRTVNQHCENAQRRLGTNNRVQTVVEAIRHKLITL